MRSRSFRLTSPGLGLPYIFVSSRERASKPSRRLLRWVLGRGQISRQRKRNLVRACGTSYFDLKNP
jgi:hypothetical protein